MSANIREASGVVRRNDELLLVSDGDPGVFYRFPLSGVLEPVIPLEATSTEKLAGGEAALDLESIEILADGRVVALSERLRALVGQHGIVAQYDDPFSEFGERGLEGIAVKREQDGSSTVAVLWEGGYPELDELPEQIRDRVRPGALRPVVLVHSIPAENTVAKPVGRKQAISMVELRVPLPPGKEPEAQRYRAPDLIWHQHGGDWQFIVLLNSQNGLDKPSYGPTLVQRFAIDGEPVGSPLDLDAIVPPVLRGANWEGLAWYEGGQSLVAVHDAPAKLPHDRPAAFVFQIPNTWK